MEEDPVRSQAPNLVTAIPVLARRAAMIALVPPPVLTWCSSSGALDGAVQGSSLPQCRGCDQRRRGVRGPP